MIEEFDDWEWEGVEELVEHQFPVRVGSAWDDPDLPKSVLFDAAGNVVANFESARMAAEVARLLNESRDR